MKLFHGTSADNLESILKNGLKIDSDKIWTASRNEIYFWSPSRLVEFGECGADYADDHAFQKASESALCAIAVAKDCRAVVIEVELPDQELSNDDSCFNMEGAVIYKNNVPLEYIKSIKVSNSLEMLKGYFIYMVKGNIYWGKQFSNLELKIANLFEKGEIYSEDIEDIIEWKDCLTN